MKIVLEPGTDRTEILKSTKELKKANDQYSKIFIKKDLHPGISREIKRLKDVEKREKENPANIGRDVRYDWKERCVKVDDQIIDKYCPSFF